MANISLGFNLSASAVGMSQGINAGVVELQKCDGSCTFRYFGELSEQFVRNAKFSAL